MVLVAVASGVWLLSRSQPRFALDLRRDLLTDTARVELQEGFDGETRLRTWVDTSRDPARDPDNPDRDEIALLVRRRSRLLWHVQARAGARLELSFARLASGPGEDAARCPLMVRVVPPTGGLVEVSVSAPSAPADAGLSPGRLREGPSVPAVVQLPEGAEAIEFSCEADPAESDDGHLALLLSPRVIQPPLGVLREEVVSRVEHATRLLQVLREAPAGEGAGRPVAERFATRTEASAPGSLQPAAGALPQAVELPRVEPVGGFAGTPARPALALLDGASAEAEVVVEPGARLRGEVALDRRLAAGARATLRVTLDGEALDDVAIESSAWVPFDLPLPAPGTQAGHAGEHRLRLELVDATLQPAPVAATDLDFLRGAEVPAVYVAERVRAGIAELRIATDAEVPRRTVTPGHPSVIVVQVETLRADALPCVAGHRPDLPEGLTPYLTEFAREAVGWERAYTPSPWTVPTTVSVLTGLPPSSHGAVTHGRMSMPPDVVTLAERARAAGVATGAVVASDLLSESQGYARGFDHFAHVPYANARQVVDQAVAFLADHLGQQTFLFVHAFDPHGPVDAPGAWRDRYVDESLRDRTVAGAEGRLIAALEASVAGRGPPPDPDGDDVRFLWQRYLGEVAWLDDQFGRLLAALKDLHLDSDTIVVFTADHGEEFLEHGLYGHGSQLFDETLHVPLLARAPRNRRLMLPGGTRVETPVGTAGLYASVLDWLGVADDGWRVNVLPALGEQTTRAEPAWSETNKGLALDGLGDPLRRRLVSAVSGDLRVTVCWPTPEEVERARQAGLPQPGPMRAFYDLATDPGAHHPLSEAGERGAAAMRYLQQFERWAEAHATAGPPAGGGGAELEALKALGYVGNGAPGPDPSDPAAGAAGGCGPPGR